MIIAKKISKIYPMGTIEFKALNNVSVEINEGEFVAIMGRSGAGKSTLLYQLSLLDTPSEGEIIFDNLNTSDLSNGQRTRFRLTKMGYIFQDYSILPELTAFENVSLPLLMQGFDNNKVQKLTEAALKQVGLGKRLNSLPNQLSGGEQQRVSIARAISNKPRVLFADEPTANLDSETSATILKIFKDLHKEGQTIVMVTHEKEYSKNAQRIIELSDGKIISDKKA